MALETGFFYSLVRGQIVNCPHCNKPGVSAWSKFMAGTAVPAKCKLCGKPSSLSGGILGTLGALSYIIILGGAISSFYYRSWWPLIISFIVYVFIEYFVVKWVPLKALSEEEVVSSRKSFYIFTIVFVLLLIFVGLTDV